jgi:hypothetical protein
VRLKRESLRKFVEAEQRWTGPVGDDVVRSSGESASEWACGYWRSVKMKQWIGGGTGSELMAISEVLFGFLCLKNGGLDKVMPKSRFAVQW